MAVGVQALGAGLRVVLCGLIPAAAAQTTQLADAMVVNARIYTLNPRQPWAQALAVRDGKILAAGSGPEIARYRGASTRVIDALGRLILPGFTDCHVHFMGGSLSLMRVDLNGASTVREIQQRVRDYALSHPNEPWILGRGWSYPVFAPSGMPDRRLLDEVVPGRPVFLTAFDGHSAWANSKALAAAGITRETRDPVNGRIVRDGRGEPTGALEEKAGELVSKLAPKPSRAERLAALRRGLREANRSGVVRIHSAGGDFEWLDLYNELRRKGELTVRQYAAYSLDPPELTATAIDKLERARRDHRDDWISGGAVKIMLDGVVEAHTAAMLASYSDDSGKTGTLFWEPARYKEAVTELDRRGFQIFTHAIGDRAVRLALDAYEEARKKNRTNDTRPRIEHIETITAEDIPRFGKLGVMASFQPLHAYPDDDTLKVWARNAGPDRTQRGFAWHSIAATGGRLAFGSDWPVVTLNPWPAVRNALTRQTTEGDPPGGWLPRERVSLAQTIEAYTIGAAIAGRREKTEGSLEAGKLADLIILSQNLFEVPPGKTDRTEVLLTMVGGKVVYESLNAPPAR